MKKFVVCIDDNWTPFALDNGRFHHWKEWPVKGETYEVVGVTEELFEGMRGYLIKGYPDRTYRTTHFRNVDMLFGDEIATELEVGISFTRLS